MTREKSSIAEPQLLVTSNAAKFCCAILLLCVSIAAIGWFTAVHTVAYSAIVSLLVAAFLPFVIIAAGILIPLFLAALAVFAALLSAVGGGGGGEAAVGADAAFIGEPLVTGGCHSIKPYYRWLARQRHPFFWGSWVGVFMGGAILIGLNLWLILPGDAVTAETLLKLETAIAEVYDDRKRYPKADENGHLLIADLNGVDVPVIDGVVVDGFGRPFEYEMEGRWRAARYRLRSYGYNGKPGGDDDMCVSHATRLARAAEFAAGVRDLLSSKKEESRIDRLTRRWDAIQSLRCRAR